VIPQITEYLTIIGRHMSTAPDRIMGKPYARLWDAGWHDLFIPSDDGTSLEAWHIPAKGGESNTLIQKPHAYRHPWLRIDRWQTRNRVCPSRP
jgi:hypothetical protein